MECAMLQHRLPGSRVLGCARLLVFASIAALGACNPEPVSWDKLIASRIAQQYPGYAVTLLEGGKLDVQRAGQESRRIEVAPIAQFCQRGPRDCEYAIDQMLLELRSSAPAASSSSR